MTELEKVESYAFDPSISAEERKFYVKAYPRLEFVRDRRTHCTTCKIHIGTAPCNGESIKMHPILRVTHCTRCHDFYNSGEFSKGEDGSELYCRWCGQGGEVYCCSNCPFVFCKSCITKNLDRGVVADIEQNENWRCFACAPKILWPLRALHWALISYIEKQLKEIDDKNLPENEKKIELVKDRSNCCPLIKTKMSDSMESIDSLTSRRSQKSNKSSTKKTKQSSPASQSPAAKRAKATNDEVVCTPDLLSMLEPDCEITVQNKNNLRVGPASSSTPKIFTVQQNYNPNPAVPPPLVLRNTGIQVRPVTSTPIIRRTVVSPRAPAPVGSNSPVYHTINGYRIDLNSAAQQGTYRLPNGKLIQVKRQSAATNQNTQNSQNTQNAQSSSNNSWQQSPHQHQQQQQQQQQSMRSTPSRPVQMNPITPQRQVVTIQSQQGPSAQVTIQPQSSTPVRYPGGVIGNTIISPYNQNGPPIQMINAVNVSAQPSQTQPPVNQMVTLRPVMMRNTYPETPIGTARTQLQEQVFSAMEICQHLTGKVQTLTNSNAYKHARNFLEVKELYIHLSYLLTYAIGRFKGLQDKCLMDMRQLGFANDADSLENGQLAAGIDYVRYGQLEDAEMFTSSMNSFHNQIYEYRKSLNANLEDDNLRETLSPLFALNPIAGEEAERLEYMRAQQQQWQSVETCILPDDDDDDDDDVKEVAITDEPLERYDETYPDDDAQDDTVGDNNDDDYYGSGGQGTQRGTEDVMRREEESHAYDRKLTRLIQQYPSIWCTRHPDYGNFEVTRKQWRTIATHFKRSEEMKMRWKNIRKRYVRIERRIQEGKRFNGYFDKATNFLINRDTPVSEWVPVDCGVDDGDMYERKTLDVIEQAIHKGSKDVDNKSSCDFDDSLNEQDMPVEIRPLDMKIIHFVKCNPVLWRKSSDPTYNKMDEQTRKSLWMHLWKSVPNVRCVDLVDRWAHLYEMYRVFRLKLIKSEQRLAAMEIKYSKYLAKLYFLYKIEEDELRNTYKGVVFGDELSDDQSDLDDEATLLNLNDDKEFVTHLMRALRDFPQIWNTNHVDYYDLLSRDDAWTEIGRRLNVFQHKQASDDEDNEIEIVEPKTDTITLDSDNDDDNQHPAITMPSVSSKPNHRTIKSDDIRPGEEIAEFMNTAHDILASMLEVDIVEVNGTVDMKNKSQQRKQPRKKMTNKPNPTLLKQKRELEYKKLQELKRNDQKLKWQCSVKLIRAEQKYSNIQSKLKLFEKRKQEIESESKKKKAKSNKDNDKNTKEIANIGGIDIKDTKNEHTKELKLQSNEIRETENLENVDEEKVLRKVKEKKQEVEKEDEREKGEEGEKQQEKDILSSTKKIESLFKLKKKIKVVKVTEDELENVDNTLEVSLNEEENDKTVNETINSNEEDNDAVESSKENKNETENSKDSQEEVRPLSEEAQKSTTNTISDSKHETVIRESKAVNSNEDNITNKPHYRKSVEIDENSAEPTKLLQTSLEVEKSEEMVKQSKDEKETPIDGSNEILETKKVEITTEVGTNKTAEEGKEINQKSNSTSKPEAVITEKFKEKETTNKMNVHKDEASADEAKESSKEIVQPTVTSSSVQAKEPLQTTNCSEKLENVSPTDKTSHLAENEKKICDDHEVSGEDVNMTQPPNELDVKSNS